MSDYDEDESDDSTKKIEKDRLEELLRTFWDSYEELADYLRGRFEYLDFKALSGDLTAIEAKEHELLKYWHDKDDRQIAESAADLGTLMVYVADFYLQDNLKCVDKLKTIDQATKK